MCFRRKKPVRLEKKENKYEIIKKVLKSKEFWIVICVGILLSIAIIFAIHESISYQVYNNGGIAV